MQWPTDSEEIRQHLDDRYRELRAGGASHDEAERLCLAQLDGVGAGAPGAWLHRDVAGDVRFAVRTFRKDPAFTAVVVLTLALGIGATAAMFSVVNAVLLRPLPFERPEQLVRIYQTYPTIAGGIEGLSPADFLTLRDGNRSFHGVATYRTLADGAPYADGAHVEQVYGAIVSADFFRVLGVRPLLGTWFEPGDDGANAEFKILVSYAFWRSRLHGDVHAVGRSIRLAGRDVTIAGVMPSGFWFPRSDRADFWMNERFAPPTRQGPWLYQVVGRLRGSISASQAQADLDSAASAVRARFPLGSADWTLVTRPFRQQLVGDLGPALWLLLAAVALVMTIALANVTNLMLARRSVREGEIALRQALGATRVRIARQLVVESLVLVAAGTGLGLALAAWAVALLERFTPQNLQLLRDADIGLDRTVVLVAAALGTASAVVFGLLPAFGGSGDLRAAMAEGERGATDRAGRRRLRSALVAAELALSLMVVAGAGLVARSLIALQRVDPGIRTDHILTAMISLPGIRYPDRQPVVFYDRLLRAIRARPGVESAAVSYGLPPDRLAEATNFIAEDRPPPPDQAEPIAPRLAVDGEYFRTLGIPLARGRTFDDRDAAESAPSVVVISRRLAEQFFGRTDPIGRKLRIAGNDSATIVGVVGNVKYEGLDAVADWALYQPFSQAAPRTVAVLVRTAGEPAGMAPVLEAELARIDPEVPLGRTRTMQALVGESVERPRFRTTLLAVFAASALVLAAIGIYGVMAYSVSRRTREIGIRVALGARPADVVRMVMGEGCRLALAGIITGLAGAAALTRTISGLLFAVSPFDPATFAAATLLLFAVAMIACWVPARRATRADPLAALRSEQ